MEGGEWRGMEVSGGGVSERRWKEVSGSGGSDSRWVGREWRRGEAGRESEG